MLARCRCSLLCVSILAVTGANLVDDFEEGRGSVIRTEERDMQIGPHGQLSAVSAHDVSLPDDQRVEYTGQDDGLLQHSVDPDEAEAEAEAENGEMPEFEGRPALTGYESAGCDPNGKVAGRFYMPHGADLSDPDNCIAVKGEDGKTPVGKLQFSCDGESVNVFVFGRLNSSCAEGEESSSMKVEASHAPLVATEACVPVALPPDATGPEETYIKFTDFREDQKWPKCLIPPMSKTDMALYATCGIFQGIIVNFCIWCCCMRPSSYHANKMDDLYGEEAYGEMGPGKGHGPSLHGGNSFDGGKGHGPSVHGGKDAGFGPGKGKW